MPQTKNGRKKWRKKKRHLMEIAALAKKSSVYQMTHPTYPIKHFVPPVPILQPSFPSPKPTVTNSSYSFTPMIPINNLASQNQIQPSMEMPTIQKKQNGFDLPDNCPTSLR